MRTNHHELDASARPVARWIDTFLILLVPLAPARKLIPRLAEVRLAGRPKYMRTTFVDGIKTVPIEFRLTD